MPTSSDDVADLLRSTSGTVVVRGGGSKSSWYDGDFDVCLDTTGLDAVIDHAVGDLVVRAQAGVRLAQLQAALAPAVQWLALDPPEAGATLGGIVATNAAGPARYSYGTPRDLLIGSTVVLADATVARSGGTVVKNVAGYDLGKLFAGSFGTLGVITEVTFRLHPLPAARRVVTIDVDDPDHAGALVATARASQVAPTAIEVCWPGSLSVLVEGTEPGVVRRSAELAAALGGTVEEDLPVGWGLRPWRADEVGARIGYLPAALPVVLRAADRLGVRLAGSAGVGSLYGALAVTAAGDVLAELRAAVTPHDGSVVVTQTAGARLDVWGPIAPGPLAVMRRVKDRFDPSNRFLPGAFVGGI